MQGKHVGIMMANDDVPGYEEWIKPRPERRRKKAGAGERSARPASEQIVNVDLEQIPEQPPSEQLLSQNAGASGTASKAAPEDLVLQARIVDEPGDLTASSAEAPTCQSSPAEAAAAAAAAGLQQKISPSTKEVHPSRSALLTLLMTPIWWLTPASQLPT